MKEYLNKFFFLIDYNYKILIVFLALFILIALLEVITLGVIIPFLTLLTSPTNFFESLYKYLPNFPKDINHDLLIIYFGILVLLIILIKSIIFLFCQYLIARFTWDEVVNIRRKLIDKYASMSYERYIKTTSSENINNIISVSLSFIKQTLRPSVLLISDLIMTAFIIIFLLFNDTMIFLTIAFVLILVAFIFDIFFKKKFLLWGINRNIAVQNLISDVKNSHYGYKEIKILNKSDIFKENIMNNSLIQSSIQTKSDVVNLMPRVILELISVFVFILIILFFLIFADNSFVNIIPKLAVFFMAALRLGPAVSAMNININHMRISHFSVGKLYNELSQENPKKQNGNINVSDEFQNFNTISFIDLSYKYPDSEKFVINNVNFEINKGEILGVTGPSGSGKTTCIDLLLGLIFPTGGKIKIDGKVLNKANASNWHKRLAYLPQELFILNTTILRNITLRNDDQHDPLFLKDILKKTNLSIFINDLPNGVKTSIGERGVNLSGGQRQRIALARSLYQKRDIVVLDESTSSLDYKTERKIINEISLLKNNATIILISHNINILSICDKIIYVNDEKVKQINNYKELFEQKEQNELNKIINR